MQTQTNRLKTYLKIYGRINPLAAWKELGIYRLGARIFDLKKQGVEIVSGRCTVINQFREKCAVAEYKLGGKE